LPVSWSGKVIRTRPARRADAAAIGRIHVETWRDSYAGLLPDDGLLRLSPEIEAERWARAIRRGATVIVAEDATAGVIGFGSCGRSRARGLPFDGEVQTLYVAPDHHGRGAGRALLVALFDALTAAGCKSALIWVLNDNPSRFFYEAMGGRHIADRDETVWGCMVAERAYGWDRLTVPCSPS
jgi:L-amino acid N-acyltransferase YncA